MAPSNIEVADIVIICVYFVIVLAVGIWATCRAKTDSAQGYFLAGRNMTFIPIGASIFSTNIGAPMFVGLAGSAASSGIPVVMFEWHAMFTLLALGWIFLPVYLSSGCISMPHYLKLRFGGNRIRVWLAIVFQFLTIVSQISGQMYAGALFLTSIFNWPLYASVFIILLVTALFTIMGGLTAVIWTDTVQTLILIIGSCVLSAIGLQKIGGFESIRNQFQHAIANDTVRDYALYGNRTCGLAFERPFNIFQAADSSSYPWPGMIFGLTILALNAWCTDQICVQRGLSAKNMAHAKAGTILAAYLKVLPFLFFIIPGMISRVMFPNEVGCSDPDSCWKICQNRKGCTNIAYPYLVVNILPTGVKGILLAALLAALMSSLTSIFNSSSTVFTMDIWRRIRRKAKESELIVSRIWTVFLAIVSILWLPLLIELQGSEFWNYTQSISSFITPPIVISFLMGIFWTRTTEKAVFSGMVVGLGIGIIRMGMEWSRPGQACGEEPNPNLPKPFDIVAKVHYLHFAIILGAIMVIWMVCVSLVTKPRPPEKLRKVTFWTRNDPDLPDYSESEDDEDEKPLTTEVNQANVSKSTKVKDCCLKWLCGQEVSEGPKLTKEEIKALQMKLTDIQEDPFWKTVLDVNGLICFAVALFLHAFWG